MALVEAAVIARGRIPSTAGHTLHRGTPREVFIKEFLGDHLSQSFAIGTGEIIDANSEPREPRNQIDIVIYRKDMPKLDLGGGVAGFFAESVLATIEVKSLLDSEELRKSMKAAKALKALRREGMTGLAMGYMPPSILSFVVAYDGPAKMQTVCGWVPSIHGSLGVVDAPLPSALEERLTHVAPTIDAVFVLGRGFMHYTTTPVGLQSEDMNKVIPQPHWVFADAENGSLLVLFAILWKAGAGMAATSFNPLPYLAKFALNGEKVMWATHH